MVKRRGRGEGSLEELPSGSWRAVLSYTDPLTKKRYRESKTFPTKRDAIQWRDKQKELRRTGQRQAGLAPIISDWVSQWLDKVRDTKEPATHKHYLELARSLITPHLGHHRLDQLTPLIIEKWLSVMATMGKSGNRRAKALAVLKNCLSHAARLGLIAFNPALNIAPPKVEPHREVWLNQTQARQLIEYFRENVPQHEALVTLALDTGARPNEVLGLQWSEIDLALGKVTIKQSFERIMGNSTGRIKAPKTRAGVRTISINPVTVAALKKLLESNRQREGFSLSEFVFAGSTGATITPHNFNRRVLRPACKVLGIPQIRMGDLRHTSISILLSMGLSIRAVATRAGHESPDVTLRRYAKALPQDDLKAVEIWGEVLSD